MKAKHSFQVRFKLHPNSNELKPYNNNELLSHKPNCNGVLSEEEYQEPTENEEIAYEYNQPVEEEEFSKPEPLKLAYLNIFGMTLLHIAFLYAVGLVLVWRTVSISQCLMVVPLFWYSGVGITAGAHRLWAHRTYKATLPLQIFLMVGQTLAMQNSIYTWVRDHRTHHKWTETDADPHNAKRGFFFAHMGWLLCKKHADVKNKVQLVDMSDLESNPVVMWQYRNFSWFSAVTFIVASLLSYRFLFDWSYTHAFFIAGIGRYVIILHGTWLINSAAHFFGPKPYDKDIHATENLALQLTILGEGYHNYHHVFPWDYKAAEWSGVYFSNSTKLFIDLMAILGLAYDLKVVPSDVVKRRVIKKGDGTHPVWGWGDKNIPKEHVEATEIIYRKSK